ncbi:antiviral reverse transcriptase Drt3a [Stutzerimonas stutzeri]|nr:antiviral reverse transcriptase Drt3a [Stutzerimonas stutzeri]MCQ4331046.1 RNA-directed DNA polymerase [Stutzerimonas stutzeri]
MIEIPYTAKALTECIGFQDVIKNPHLQDRSRRADEATAALAELRAGSVFNGSLREISLGSAKGYVFTTLAAKMVSRLISRNIKANYHIKQSDRQTIISNVLSFFKEGTPYAVYRFDLVSFYESIDRKVLFDRLMADSKCSWRTLVLLDQLFAVIDICGVAGLPRGLGVSATLSEFYLSSFDQAIKSDVDVFYYARFVDDIIVITSGRESKNDFEKKLLEFLPAGLDFHKVGDKRSYHTIPKAKEPHLGLEQKKFQIKYLGYQMKIFECCSEEAVLGSLRRKVVCDISQDKVLRIKKKFIAAISSFLSSAQLPPDYLLLKNRVRALTGNYNINDPMSGIEIKTGIYFNYIQKNYIGHCSLDELDVFMRGVLFSSKHQLSRRIASALTLQQRKLLAGYSFKTGFKKIRFHSFKYETLRKIKECWRK